MKKHLKTRIICILGLVLGVISNTLLSDGTFLVLCILLFGPLLIFPEWYYAE